MGVRLVSLVLSRWTQLPDREFRVLIRMAASALDKASGGNPASIYFGGQDLLTSVLRNERKSSLESLRRAVRRVIARLIDRKVVERVDSGRTGHNAVYRLKLDATPSIEEPPSEGGESIDATFMDETPTDGEPGGHQGCPPQADTKDVRAGGHQGCPPQADTKDVPPRRMEEDRGEYLEEERELRTDVQAVLTTGGAPPPDPRRPHAPTTSGHGTESASSPLSVEQQPPQPESATHDRAREAGSESGPELRIVEGNPHAIRTERTGLFPAPVPAAPAARRGFGFCLACHADGHTVLAVDDQNGDACAKHLRSA